MELKDITPYQATFTVFYAIACGAIFNVLGPWKPFQSDMRVQSKQWSLWSISITPLESELQSRWWLSFWWFNFAPIAYYAAIMGILLFPAFDPPTEKTICHGLAHICRLVACVIASGAAFGFYRCWLGEVQANRERYCFLHSSDNDYYIQHKSLDEDGRSKKISANEAALGRRNCQSGAWYIAISSAAIPVSTIFNWLIN